MRKISNYSSSYIAYGIEKKVHLYKIKLYRFFKPKISFKGDIKTVKRNIKKTVGEYSNFSAIGFEDISFKQVIRNAENVINNKFELLGSGLVDLNPIDWHTDFKSGFTWEKGTFYLNYKQVDLRNNADVKVPRELSRSHFLLWLGIAYLHTNDEKYTAKFIELVTNWITENPLMRSINWGCTMDVAIRAVNWIYAFEMFENSSLISDEFSKIFFNSLYQHGWFINNNPEKAYVCRANHYDADLLGKLLLGSIFSNTADGKKWYNTAKNDIFNEIRIQVLPSGVIYEKTINYIRLVQEMFILVIIWLKNNNETLPEDILYRVEKTFDFLIHYTKPNNHAPVVGDIDNARILPFGVYEITNHKYLYPIGATIFDNPKLKYLSSEINIDLFFLLGQNGINKFKDIKEQKVKITSKSFKDAGFFIMRSDNNYMFINNSGPAKFIDTPLCEGSHTHADMLSFELQINMQDIFVDAGTYVYTSDYKMRNLFRSTAMHNTLTVDNEDQYKIEELKLFKYGSKASAQTLKWESNKEQDIYKGMHNGYLRLKNKTLHTREFIFNKNNLEWTIKDIIAGEYENNITLYFHLAKNLKLTIEDDKSFIKLKTGILLFNFISEVKFNLTIEKGYLSPSYGVINEANIIKIDLQKPAKEYTFTTQLKYIADEQ